MSRIDDLIADACPDGVEHRTLGEIGVLIRGRRFTKADYVEEGLGSIHYGEIYTDYGTWATEVRKFVRPELKDRLRLAQTGDVVIAATGENVKDVCKAVAWLGSEKIAVHDDCYIFRHDLDPKYVSYFFQAGAFQEQKTKFATESNLARISGANLEKIRMPVPPPAIQREIVVILDKMEALKAELESELESELDLRSRQHAHYRDELMSPMGEELWPTVRVRDVADVLVGFAFKSAAFSDDGNDTRLVRGDNIGQGVLKRHYFKRWPRRSEDGLERYELRVDDVVLAMDRPWIPAGLKWARIAGDDLPALLVQRVARLRGHPAVISQRFLGCVIASSSFTTHVLNVQSGNTVPHISGNQIDDFTFCLPPISEQVRLAELLDKFDASVNDLTIGLPAEIAARRAQYEYYRDRLLTFDEAVA